MLLRKAHIACSMLLVGILALASAVGPMSRATVAQGVDWLSDESESYLTSSGIPVMVPSWIPSPVNGVQPEISASDGSYSIYFYYSGTTYLYLTGVAGAGFPGGSEADLNVPLEVNTSVQGYPAIQDPGLPAGSSTPIYDKVMWIAGGVLYTVNGNGLDSTSLSLANSAVTLSAPAAPDPTSPPATEAPDTSVEPTTAPVDDADPTAGPVDDTVTTDTAAGDVATDPTAEPTPVHATDGTDGPPFTGVVEASDGTEGPPPPDAPAVDGTGGA